MSVAIRDGKFFYTLQKKVGFCGMDKKISLNFQQDFPYSIVFWGCFGHYSGSAEAKAETLSMPRNIENFADNYALQHILLEKFRPKREHVYYCLCLWDDPSE